MSYSRLDQIYRSILITKFFTKGWGTPDNLKRLFEFKKFVSNRESCIKLVSSDYPITITKEETCSDCKIIEGQFLSPFVVHLPGIMPKESETAYFQIVLPRKWTSEHYKPVCLHLAGTGDHGFWRRRQLMAKPLIKQSGIGAILLENPFYGLRKPKDQVRSNLHNVSDIFVMGGCLILESLALFHWCERVGLGPLGITGLSMGGHMASLAATNWPKPIALVPCLSWSTASLVFTEGVMSAAINWSLLAEQYFSDIVYQEEIKKMVCVEGSAFQAGQQFAKNYPESMSCVSKLDSNNNSNQDSLNNVTSIDNCSLAEAENQNSCNPINRISTEDINDLNENSRILHLKGKENMELSAADVDVSVSDNSIVTKSGWDLSSMFSRKTSNSSPLTDFNESKSRLVSSLQESVHEKPLTSITPGAKVKDRETLQFMRGIMDECTHLRNFDVPVDTSLIIAVCAKDDAYVPREGCAALTDIWPGAEVRYLNSGHVGAFLLHHRIFRAAIAESFERLRKKYPTQG